MDWTPEIVAQAQALYDAGLTPRQVARKLGYMGYTRGLTASEVREAINCHRSQIASPELRREARRIRQTKWISYTLIADRLGTTRDIVENACKGLRPPPGLAIKGARSAYTMPAKPLGHATNGVRITLRKPEPIQIPAWVEAMGFADSFQNIAEKHGEEQAASVARMLKRGQSVAWL
jgi:hypothetical protein